MKKRLEKYWARFSSDQNKKRQERAILLRYLTSEQPPFSHYRIEKRLHPDFVLIGSQCIGIEVTQLTTQSHEIMARIANQQFGQGKTAKQIETEAIAEHGNKAKQYSFYDFGTAQAIGSPAIDINSEKKYFAEQIVKKFHKYQEMLSQFDSFYILADGKYSIALTNSFDVKDVYDAVVEKEPEINRLHVAFLWNDGRQDQITLY